jgi:hypothetical protein
MEAIMQRFAIGVMVAGLALSVGSFEAAAGCGAHNETVTQKNTVTEPQDAQQALTVAQPQGTQQALSTVPVATTPATRDSGSATAQQ